MDFWCALSALNIPTGKKHMWTKPGYALAINPCKGLLSFFNRCRPQSLLTVLGRTPSLQRVVHRKTKYEGKINTTPGAIDGEIERGTDIGGGVFLYIIHGPPCTTSKF